MAGVNVVPITPVAVIGVLGGGSVSNFDWGERAGVMSPMESVPGTVQCCLHLKVGAAWQQGCGVRGGLSAFTTGS